MLSHLLRFAVVDGRGATATLVDLTADLAGDYPTVRQVLARVGTSLRLVDWREVTEIEHRRRRVRIGSLERGRAVGPDDLAMAVLLSRDVMDAQVLDLASRQATLANDLWLAERDGQLILRGADLGSWAVLRRLARGILGHGSDRNLVDWKDVEFLRGDPAAALAGRDYHRRIGALMPAEIASLVDALPYLHAAELLALLDDGRAADVLEMMSPERQLQVFEELPEATATRLLARMAPDLAADLLAGLEPSDAASVLGRLPEARRARIVELLRYPEDSAGGIMTNDIIVLPTGITVDEARRRVAELAEGPDFIYFVYVVEDESSRAMRGMLTLRQIIAGDGDRTVDEVMARDLVSAEPLEPAGHAAQRLVDLHLIALPVVDRGGRLLGAITVDAAVAQIAPQRWRNLAPRVFA